MQLAPDIPKARPMQRIDLFVIHVLSATMQLGVLVLIANSAAAAATRSPSIQACIDHAKHHGWVSGSELKAWTAICRSEDAIFEERDNALTVDFIRSVVFDKCLNQRIGPRGVHIIGAKFKNGDTSVGDSPVTINLDWGAITWSLRLESCDFQSLSLNHFVSSRDIEITQPSAKPSQHQSFNIRSASIFGNVRFDGSLVSNINLSGTRIGGSLSMQQIKAHKLILRFASIGVEQDGSIITNQTRSQTAPLLQGRIEQLWSHYTSLKKPMLGGPVVASAVGDLNMKGAILGVLNNTNAQSQATNQSEKNTSAGTKSTPAAPKASGGLQAAGVNPEEEQEFKLEGSPDVNLEGTLVRGRVHLWNICRSHESAAKIELHGLKYDMVVPHQCSVKTSRSSCDDQSATQIFQHWLRMDDTYSFQPYSYLSSRLRDAGEIQLAEDIRSQGLREMRKSKADRNEELEFKALMSRTLNRIKNYLSRVVGWLTIVGITVFVFLLIGSPVGFVVVPLMVLAIFAVDEGYIWSSVLELLFSVGSIERLESLYTLLDFLTALWIVGSIFVLIHTVGRTLSDGDETELWPMMKGSTYCSIYSLVPKQLTKWANLQRPIMYDDEFRLKLPKECKKTMARINWITQKYLTFHWIIGSLVVYYFVACIVGISILEGVL